MRGTCRLTTAALCAAALLAAVALLLRLLGVVVTLAELALAAFGWVAALNLALWARDLAARGAPRAGEGDPLEQDRAL